MGGWKLEVGKMVLYMGFPVGIFYFFNQPKYFEDWVVKVRREMYPPLEKMHTKEVDECIRKMHEQRERELLKALGEEKTEGDSVM